MFTFFSSSSNHLHPFICSLICLLICFDQKQQNDEQKRIFTNEHQQIYDVFGYLKMENLYIHKKWVCVRARASLAENKA